jgi:hypothetical protein
VWTEREAFDRRELGRRPRYERKERLTQGQTAGSTANLAGSRVAAY